MKKTRVGRIVQVATLLMCFIALFTTCKNNIGLGGTVDINPPTVKNDSVYPPNNAIIKGAFKLAVKADDDTGVNAVTAVITTADSKNSRINIGNSFLQRPSSKDGYWTLDIDPKGQYPITDGDYKLEIQVTDTVDKVSTVTSAFTIDNTPPLLILNRPSTAIKPDETLANSTPDEFGFDFLLVGQVYDESAVPTLKITAEGNGQKREKTLNNIPQNIRITVDSFGNSTDNPFYKPLYNGEENGGTKPYEYGITVTDSAKEYNNPGDAGSGTGNTTDRYYLFDDLYKPVLSTYMIQDVYAMLRGTYTSKPNGTRSAEEISQDEKTAANVREELQNNQLGGGAKTGTFALNPSRNPRFAIAGEEATPRPSNPSATPSFSPLYSGSSLKVKISRNLDGVPLEGTDTYRFFLMKWSDFLTYTGSSPYPTEKINGTGADSIYANEITQTLKPELVGKLIPMSNPSFKIEGSNYLVTIPISESLGIAYNNNYVLLVRGKDQNGNKLVPDLTKVNGGAYGFNFVENGKVPEVYVTKIKGSDSGHETNGTGTDPDPNKKNITERIYLKKGDGMVITVHISGGGSNQSLQYELKGTVGGDVTQTDIPVVSNTITIPSGKFDQNDEKTYTLTVRATASTGNSLLQTYYIVYDVKEPEADITTLVNNAVINETNGTAFSVSGTAFDTGIGLENVSVKLSKIDGNGAFTDRALTVTTADGRWSTEAIDLSVVSDTDPKKNYGEGKYTLTMTATDKLGWKKSITRTFYFDKKAPEITNLKVNGESVVNGGTVYTNTTPVVVTGNVTESYGIETFTINGDGSGLPSTTGTVNKTLNLTEDKHSVVIVLKDKADQSAPDFKFDVVVDKTAPVFQNIKFGTSNASGALITTSDNPIKVSGTIKDAVAGRTVSGVEAVYYAVTASTASAPADTSADWKQLNGTFSGNDYELDGFIEKLSLNVEQKIHIRAVDNAGNKKLLEQKVQVVPVATSVITWTLALANNTSPSGTCEYKNGTWYAKGQFKVKIGGILSGAPAAGSAMTVEITKKGTPHDTSVDLIGTPTSFFASKAGPELKIYPTDKPTEYTVKPGCADGEYTIKIRSGGQSQSLTFMIDGTEPTITPATSGSGVLPANNAWVNTKTLFVDGTAADVTSGIEKIEAIVNNGTPKLLGTDASWSGYLTLNEGDNTVQFKVTDKAGNTKDTAARTIKVDSQPPNQPVITDVDGTGASLSLTVSGTKNITIKGTVSDLGDSGINAVQWKLGTANGTATLSSGTWELTIPKANVDAGSVIITATDRAGNTSIPVTVVFIKDTTPPTAKIVNFDTHTAQTGEILVRGSVTDSNVDGSATKWKIIKTAETKPTVAAPGAPESWKKVDNPTTATWEITALNLKDYFIESSGVYTSAYAKKHVPDDGLFDLPLYLYVADTSGNAAVVEFTILVDPAGDKPVIEITEPKCPLAADPENKALVVGGSVRIYGGATVKKGYVGEVYIDVAKDKDFTTFIPGWNNKKITGTGNWSCELNKQLPIGEVYNEMPSGKTTLVVYYRVRAKNGETGALGGYSETQMLKFDKGAPVIDPATFGKTSSSAKPYEARSWISGDDKSLYFKIHDESGIKQVTLTINGSTNTYEDTTDSPGGTNQIATCPATVATFTPGIKHGSYYDYDVTIPLKTTAFGSNKEYTVSIEIIEGAKTGNKYLTQFAQYVFKCDNEKPKGIFGHYEDSVGRFDFNGTTVPSGINTTAQNGKCLFIDGETRKITASGLNSAITGQHYWALYKEADYLVKSSQVGGLVYDDGGSGLEKITGKLLLGSAEKKTFTLDKEHAGVKMSGLQGNLYSWYEALDVTSLDDGKYQIKYTATDTAGNVSDEISRTVYVKNHELSISKLKLGTNLNRDGEIKGLNSELYEFAVGGTTDSYTKRFTATPVISNFALKYKGQASPAKPSGLIAIETAGTGQGAITYTLKLNGTALPGHTNKTLPNAETSAGDLNGFRIITLSYSDVQAITANGVQSFVLELHDTPVGGLTYTQDTVPAKMTMSIQTAFEDTTNPSGSITPLYWNSATDNSLKGNDTKNGHIEIQATADMNTAYGNIQPAVSGAIVLRGVAYDETLLSSIKLNLPGNPTVTYQDGVWSNTPGFTVKDVLTTSGHYAVWEYEWATGDPQKALEISLTVTDAAASSHSLGAEQVAAFKTATDRALRSAVFADVTDLKPGQQLRFVSDSDKDLSYLVVIERVDETAKKVSWPDSGKDVPIALTKCFVYTATSNEPKLSVNVVPYITGIETKLTTAYSSNPTVFSRSATGAYSVRNDETITVKGFNLKSGGSPTVSIGTISGSPTTNEIKVALLSSSAQSGELDVTVDSVKSINNINSNAVYNMQPNNANNDLLNDDTKLHVWQFNAVNTDTGVRYPTMRIGKDSGQAVGFVYGSGPQAVKMNLNGQDFRIDYSFTQWYDTGVAVDNTGKIYGAAMNADSGSNGDQDNGTYANFGFYAWNTQGNPGKINNKNPNMHPSADMAYYDGHKKVALENAFNDSVFNSNRIVSPKIATNGSGKVYTAYYDASANQVKFRYGTVSGNPNTDSQLTFGGALGNHDNTNQGSAAGAVAIATGDTAGPYVAVGVVPTGATAGAGTALVAWYDPKNQRLLYKYSTSTSDYSSANWSSEKIIDTGFVGWYVDLVADKDGGIHIAYYSAQNGDLKYAYLSKYDATPQTYSVDSYLSVGTNISIEVSDTKKSFKKYKVDENSGVVTEDGTEQRYVPYISSYMSSFMRTQNSVRVAWLADIKPDVMTENNKYKANPNKSFADGVKNDKYTGTWEAMTIPTRKIPLDYTVGVGIKKNTSNEQSVMLGYGTTEGLETALLE